MAMLGTTLMSGMLSHSDAEKMFRPWWDNIRSERYGKLYSNISWKVAAKFSELLFPSQPQNIIFSLD